MHLDRFEKLVSERDPDGRRLLWHTPYDGASGYLTALIVGSVPSKDSPPVAKLQYSFYVASCLSPHSGAEISRVVVSEDKDKIEVPGVTTDTHLTLHRAESGLYGVEARIGRIVISAEGKWDDALPPHSSEEVNMLRPKPTPAPGFTMLQW